MNPTDPALTICARGLSRNFGKHLAVKPLDLDVRRGEVVGLLGPNGAGKSTTMQMLTGNLAPGTGEIRICGIDLLESPKLAKARIGYLPETPPLYRELTVREYLELAARLRFDDDPRPRFDLDLHHLDGPQDHEGLVLEFVAPVTKCTGGLQTGVEPRKLRDRQQRTNRHGLVASRDDLVDSEVPESVIEQAQLFGLAPRPASPPHGIWRDDRRVLRASRNRIGRGVDVGHGS
jgi:ABC-type sugar transport system ATPase subunit